MIGVEVYYDAIPIGDETQRLCNHYHVDPLGTFASGSLLIAADPSITGTVIETLRANGISATRIGSMKSKDDGMLLIKGADVLPLPVYQQDELSKLFG